MQGTIHNVLLGMILGALIMGLNLVLRSLDLIGGCLLLLANGVAMK